MGNRANIIVVDQGVELYHSHWAADTLHVDLACLPGGGSRWLSLGDHRSALQHLGGHRSPQTPGDRDRPLAAMLDVVDFAE